MKWVKDNSETNYVLKYNDEVILEMHFDYGKKGVKAICQSITETFVIETESFWKSNVLIKENEIIIAKTTTDKWYSSLSTLDIKEQKIKFKFRNNPLAEIVFFTETEENLLLSCGLKSDKKGMIETVLNVGANLTENPIKNYLLALCWYIFKPIAEENTVDALTLIIS
ncbi:hypothetical protein GCM10011514_29170 [Emticicia aquatilis]|uniref:Uncharacterized protein n=1 Tax=Emticicia aquatilis TaxID=1537369 RepID=A0A916YWM9_9BACT|nr:hypothetical protein [Emticicia aquatilis]GGD63299.1 hypothetical protein GCM10011514_29170 [Emticicia aquatilis]